MTPTNRLSGFGTGLATNSDSGERVPQGQGQRYSNLEPVLTRLPRVARLLVMILAQRSVDDPAVLEVHQLVRILARGLVVSSHKHGGAAFCDVSDEPHHRTRRLGVQLRGRLVSHEEQPLPHACTSERHALLLAASQLVRTVARAIADTYP